MSRKGIITAVFALALALRLWGIWFGLPGIDHGDESEVVNHALRFGSGDLNPHRFQYGSFFQYILFTLYGLYFTAGYLAGAFPTVQSFAIAFVRDPSAFYLIARCLSALFGALTVIVTYRMGCRLRGPAAGTGAALLMAVCFEHAVHSHYATVDVFLTLLFTCALYRSLLVVENPSYKNILIAGLAAGLSMAVKFNGAFAAIAVVLAAYAGQQGLSAAQRFFSARMLAALCVIPLGHFLASPFFYISLPAALEEIRQLRAMHASETFTLLRYLKGLATGQFGIPAGALCLAGFCRLMVVRDNRVRILLVTTAALLLFISLHAYTDPRYIFQVFPVFAVAGAVLITEIIAPVKSRVLVALIWAALLAHPLYRTAAWDMDHSRRSATLQAKDWIEENIPVNAKVLIDNAGNKGPKLETSPEHLRAQYERARRHGLLKADYLALKMEVEPRIYYRLYEVADPAGSRDDDYRNFCLWADLEEIGHPPDYYRSKGFEYIVVTKRLFAAMAQEGFVLLKEFRQGKKAIRVYRVAGP